MMDDETRRFVDQTIARCDQERRDFELWQSRRQQQCSEPEEPEPVPAAAAAVTHAELRRQLEELTDIVAEETARVDAALMKRIERLERLEEIELLRTENAELRQKCGQLERRVVFVDLSKTSPTASDDDTVLDFNQARAATRSRDVA
jgi:hypothetical protein